MSIQKKSAYSMGGANIYFNRKIFTKSSVLISWKNSDEHRILVILLRTEY